VIQMTFVKHWDERAHIYAKIPSIWPVATSAAPTGEKANDEAYKADRPDFEEMSFGSGPLGGCSVRFGKDSALGAAFAKHMRPEK
jgi:hypothetical protein